MRHVSSESRPRRLGLVAPLAIAAVVAVIVGFAVFGRRPPPDPQAEPTPAAQAPPAAPLAVTPDPSLDRAALLQAASGAAAAYAGGGEVQGPAKGARFDLRLPFGCAGPEPRETATQAFYEFDAERRIVRLVARPAAWAGLPQMLGGPAAAQDARPEDVEGFWIPRPWDPAEACPPARREALPALPTSAATETVGLAQLFGPEASRVPRRSGRPYEKVLRLAEGDSPPAAGYRLRLEGRFSGFPDGRTARCWAESPGHRPVCLYAVAVDRVSFESATGETLAEWRE